MLNKNYLSYSSKNTRTAKEKRAFSLWSTRAYVRRLKFRFCKCLTCQPPSPNRTSLFARYRHLSVPWQWCNSHHRRLCIERSNGWRKCVRCSLESHELIQTQTSTDGCTIHFKKQFVAKEPDITEWEKATFWEFLPRVTGRGRKIIALFTRPEHSFERWERHISFSSTAKTTCKLGRCRSQANDRVCSLRPWPVNAAEQVR